MSVTDDIKSRIDIVNYVQRFVPTLKKAGRNYKAPCPFHNEKTPSFIVNPERQTWHCFGACAEGGDLFTFAQKIHGWDFKEALRELAAEAGVELRKQSAAEKSRSEERQRLLGLLGRAAEFYQRQLQRPESRAILNYARQQRGLTDATIKDFQLGYAPNSWDFMLGKLRRVNYEDAEIIEAGLAIRNEAGRVYDRFRNRLMIPIHDGRGRVVGFGGRAMDPEDRAKYINSPQSALFNKSHLLFALHKGRRAIRDSGTVVIVEGYLDAIQAHQAGYLNVVAQMGTALTERQIRLVAPSHAQKIVLALDSDAAGQTAARRSLEVARQTLTKDYAGKLSVDLRILSIPAGKDPDDYLRESPDLWPELVAGAQEVADFVIDMETKALPAGASLQEREAVARSVLPLLMATENKLYQQENLQKLARRLRIAERQLLAWAQAKLPAPAPPPRQIAEPPPDFARGESPVPPPDVEPPPEFWPAESEAPPPDVAAPLPAKAPPSKRVAEAYCLSLLLKNPGKLYRVNRRLRELAANEDALLRGPLCDLGAKDFTEGLYHELMRHLQAALDQDDKEPLDYLRAAFDRELQTELTLLLRDDLQFVKQSLNDKYEADLDDIFKRRLYRMRLALSLSEEMISRALHLRLERLENERVEMQYLQEEAQSVSASDPPQNATLDAKILLSLRAKARIDRAISQKNLPLQKQPIS